MWPSGTGNWGIEANMIRRRVTIINKLGLHARAASKFVGCASAFASTVRLGPPDNLVDGKSIMSIMMLAAAKGAELELEVHGNDAEAALQALVALIENKFDEEQ